MMSLAFRQFFLKPLDFSSLALGAGAGAGADSGAGSFGAKLNDMGIVIRKHGLKVLPVTSFGHAVIHTCFLFVFYFLLCHCHRELLSIIFFYFFQGSLCILLHGVCDIAKTPTFF